MGHEICFLAVGDESKSGDAIALRYGNLHGSRSEQTVVVIDGGYTQSGKDLVSHIKNYFDTDTVDLVILTHPDSDHASGLYEVLNELKVKKLWMHKPWEHKDGKAVHIKDGRVTDNSIAERLKNALETAYGLYKLAIEKDIPIEEPFAGKYDNTGFIQVIGPSYDYYNELLLGFSGMPETIIESKEPSFFIKVKEAIQQWVSELWHIDLITDDGETTSYQNNSSVIVQLTIDNKRFLFTGDAGREALEHACNYIGDISILPPISFIQIPHHGSFKNIGPTVLDKLVGKSKDKGSTPHFTAFCSAAKKGAPKHPSKKVLNAFTRRGANVYVTAGQTKINYNDTPNNQWSRATPEPFYDNVEE